MQPQSSAGTLLTDLCSICHVNPIKYTCPRCGVHTCSLTCVKRHKAWAQCSGVRNPAEYRKKSELATPASIDKDYNFIANVERSLQRADNSVASRGIDLKPARLQPTNEDSKSRLQSEIDSRGITIIRAPKGLSRSKQNRSHWAGNTKCIMWTVEWVLQNDRDRRITNQYHETKTVEQAYNITIGKTSKNFGKRKRGQEGANNTAAATPKVAVHATAVDGEQAGTSETSPSSNAQRTASTSNTADVVDPNTQSMPQNELGLDNSSSDTIYFYLHRPNTEARYKCLIPLSPDTTIKEALNGKTVVEYPIFYVSSVAPDALVEPFITENEYLVRYGKDIPINITTAKKEVDEEENEEEEGEIVPESTLLAPDVSSNKVLEVLAQDLGGQD